LAHKWPTATVRFSADGKILATGDGPRLVLWDPHSGKAHPLEINAGQSKITSVAFTIDGKMLATGSADRAVKLWNLPATPSDSAKPLVSSHTFTGFDVPVTGLNFSTDGKYLLAASSSVEVLDVAERKSLHKVPGEIAVFSPEGDSFVTGGGPLAAGARIWNTMTGVEQLQLVGGHDQEITSLTYAAHGRRILTGCAGGKLRCWDAQTGDEVPDFSGLNPQN
jgi:WD40 repeat protein